jgi:hypothetical protein
MRKPERKQGRNSQVGSYALAYARASAILNGDDFFLVRDHHPHTLL